MNGMVNLRGTDSLIHRAKGEGALCGAEHFRFYTVANIDCPECLRAMSPPTEPDPELDLMARCRKQIMAITPPSAVTDSPAQCAAKPRKPSRAEALEDVAWVNRLFCDQVLQQYDAKDPSEVTPAENVLLDYLRGVRERNDEALRSKP